MDTNFTAGELLEWRSRDGGPGTQLTIRLVAFHGLTSDPGTATVAFGLRADGTGQSNLWTAPVSELSRPARRELPEYLRPRPALPPSPRITIEERTAALQSAYTERAAAREAAAQAETLVQRTNVEITATTTELRRLAEQDAAEATEVEKALRDETAIPAGEDIGRAFIARARAQRNLDRLTTALKGFSSELADASKRLAKAETTVHSAAAGVLAAVIEGQADELKKLDERAKTLRSRLRAAIELRPHGSPVPVPRSVAESITAATHMEEPVGSIERWEIIDSLQKPFAELFQNLVEGHIKDGTAYTDYFPDQ